MVPPASLGDARAPRYSGYRQPTPAFAYGGLTLYAAPSQALLLAFVVPCGGPTTPGQFPDLVWALPRSLAATEGVSFDFLSYGYLDVSVPRVGPAEAVTVMRPPGFPIRTSPDHRVLARSPRLFAGSCVLLRLLLPRHPPHALDCFITKTLQCTERHSLAGASLLGHFVYPSIQLAMTKNLTGGRAPTCGARSLTGR